MARSKKQRETVRKLKAEYKLLSDEQLVEIRKTSDVMIERKTAKAILISRHRPKLPPTYERLNQRPAVSASEKVWSSWRKEYDEYVTTDEYQETSAAIDAADRRVNELLGEDESTEQSGARQQ